MQGGRGGFWIDGSGADDWEAEVQDEEDTWTNERRVLSTLRMSEMRWMMKSVSRYNVHEKRCQGSRWIMPFAPSLRCEYEEMDTEGLRESSTVAPSLACRCVAPEVEWAKMEMEMQRDGACNVFLV